MSKFILLFLLIFFNQFQIWGYCPSDRDLWNIFQKTLQKTNPQKELLRLKGICQNCNIKDSTYAQILQKIAENYHTQKMYGDANLIIQEAIKLNSSPHSKTKKSHLVDNYILLARIINEQGDYQKALETYDRCIALAMTFREKSLYIPRQYSQKANILCKMGDYERAIKQASIGIMLAQQRGSDSLSSICYAERAKAWTLLGKNKEARQDLNRVITILQKEKLTNTLPYVYYNLAQLSSKEYKSLEAIDFFKKAQSLYIKLGDNYSYSWSYVGIGFEYYNLKEYDNALKNFEQGLKTMKEPFQKVLILDDIAAAYWMKKDYPKAFKNYQKALSVAPIGFKTKNSFDNPTVKNLKIADFKTFYLTTLTDKADTWLEYYQTTKQKKNLKIAGQEKSITAFR